MSSSAISPARRQATAARSAGRQRRQDAAHLVERPAQVDRGRARFVQAVPDHVECGVGGIVGHLDGDAVGGRHADQRRAAHPHVADRRGDALDRADRLDAERMRQPALVDDVDGAAVLVQPDGAVVAVSDFQATIPFSMRTASALISSRPWMRSRLTHEVAAELQRLCFTGSAQILVGDGLEIGIVGETEDAAVDLDAGEAQHVDPDVVQHAVERLLAAQRIAVILEQAAVVEHAGALAAPEMRELGAEDRPGLDDDAEQIGAHRLAVAASLFVAGLSEIGHPEIGEQHADIEGHRSVEGEFRIDDARVVVGHHDRAGVQVAVQQRLGVGGEQMLQLLRLDLEVAVGAQFGNEGVELRRGVPVHRRFEIGVGEDQVLGDVAKLDVVGEERQIFLASAGFHGKVGAAEQRARQ